MYMYVGEKSLIHDIMIYGGKVKNHETRKRKFVIENKNLTSEIITREL